MNYYILNINHSGKSEVDFWLGEKSFAPIFYGKCTIAQLRDNNKHGLTRLQYVDARLFIDTFSNAKRDSVIFSIGNECVYIFCQSGPLLEYEVYRDDLVKGLEIKLLKKIKIKDCPLVLVSIKANRYVASGTFKSLSQSLYDGNTRALDYLLNGKRIRVKSFGEYLQCLSSLEFETFVAKYLEECGLFVPAYKGGFIRNYDLFCRNTTSKTIRAGEITVKPGDSISIQVKLRLNRRAYRESVDYFFCIFSELVDTNVFDYKYLLKNIERIPNTKKWLEETLYWVLPNYSD